MSFALGFFTALLALGLAAFLRVRRWRRFGRGRLPLRGLLARLHATPEQERVLLAEAAALREELHALRAEAEPLRSELAALLAQPSLDQARVDSVLAAREPKLTAARRRVAAGVARFHAVLDDAQRATLATLVRDGHRGYAFGHARRC